ncbi:hypothetical protein [Actinoplanes sp. M2I2]|uniref:hypothetical protein n=1 Tax=Actinoplanes sp. M2I2 TaxID=1734444 RepID=UPI002020A8DB|nr:hypothetical protein [Actinoplanes sp. M2I2]
MALLLTTVMIELFVVGFASVGFEEVADASPFGRPGTAIASAVIAGVALLGTAVAWRGSHGVVRTLAALAVFVAVGVVAMMAVFFIAAGGTPIILAVLLVLVAVSMGMIGRAVLQSPSVRARR